MNLNMGLIDALKKGLFVHSPAAMEALGRGLAREAFAKGGALALYGDLGSGKTTLVRGMAQALEIKNITSPSFNYYFVYPNAAVPLVHLDAYRLTAPADYPSLMIDEQLTPSTLFVIEWPEKLGQFLPKSALSLQLSIVGEGTHLVKLAS